MHHRDRCPAGGRRRSLTPRRSSGRHPADTRGARSSFDARGPALAAALVVALVGAGPAAAAEGLYLTWNDCFQGASATSNRDFACDVNTGIHELYCAFTMPQATDQVIATEVVVDIQHSSATLPDWWQLDEGSGCRRGSLTASVDFQGKTACVDMWQGFPAIEGLQGYIVGEPRGGSNQARIKVATLVQFPNEVSLDATSMYYAVRILIDNAHTIDPSPCAGCAPPACLVLNSILIGRAAGAPGGNVFLQTPGPADANWARWQGGAGANCAAVPVRNRTWGEIKSLYR
jgi:hypothetical protein